MIKRMSKFKMREDADKNDVNETTQDDEDDDAHDDDEKVQDENDDEHDVDEKAQDDDEEQSESDDDGDDFVHPKLTTHDDDIIHEEEMMKGIISIYQFTHPLIFHHRWTKIVQATRIKELCDPNSVILDWSTTELGCIIWIRLNRLNPNQATGVDDIFGHHLKPPSSLILCNSHLEPSFNCTKSIALQTTISSHHSNQQPPISARLPLQAPCHKIFSTLFVEWLELPGVQKKRSGKEPRFYQCSISENETRQAGKTTSTGSKTHKKSASQSAPVEETMQTTDVFEAHAHQEFEKAVHDLTSRRRGPTSS
ncbi:hypothetical protein Tco_1517811 [Tanacetum coccineum]